MASKRPFEALTAFGIHGLDLTLIREQNAEPTRDLMAPSLRNRGTNSPVNTLLDELTASTAARAAHEKLKHMLPTLLKGHTTHPPV